MFRFAALALTGALMFPSTAYAESRADGEAIVYCHDIERALVQPVRLRHCQGKVVSPDQAAIIHAQIEAERRSRKARVLSQTANLARQGFRFKSAGAAFAVNRNGDLLTSAHVIRGCDALQARNDGDETPRRVRVKAVANDSDLAVIRVEGTPPAVLSFSPRPPADGSPLALIGYPAEGMIRRIPSLTPVLVSHAIAHPSSYGLVGVAGNVRRGNSGGPALDSRGRVVGVLKAKINTVAAHRLTGRVLKNLGVVVDRERVLHFLEESRTPYRIERAKTGELSGRDLFAQGRRAVYRIDCLVRQ